MEENDKKEQVKKTYQKLLQILIKWGLNETVAKIITGAAIGSLLALLMTSCETITPTQINALHSIYHEISNEPCIFEVENTK